VPTAGRSRSIAGKWTANNQLRRECADIGRAVYDPRMLYLPDLLRDNGGGITMSPARKLLRVDWKPTALELRPSIPAWVEMSSGRLMETLGEVWTALKTYAHAAAHHEGANEMARPGSACGGEKEGGGLGAWRSPPPPAKADARGPYWNIQPPSRQL